MGTKSQNHYEVLGLWRDAGEAEIRRAYRRLAMLNHPDVSSDPGAEERFRTLQKAYDVLSDPAARAKFDATLGVGVRSDRDRAGSDRDNDVPSDWTPPWVRDWNAEAWLRANAGQAPWSVHAIGAELRSSWKTLAGHLFSLALIIAVCGLLDWAIPGLDTAVVAVVFMLPFFAYALLALRWVQGSDEVRFNSRRRRSRAQANWANDAEHRRKPH